jgi:hypothetical protein
MAFVSVGSISVGPTDLRVVIGEVLIPPGHDTLWTRVVQSGGESPWPLGFGLLSWQSQAGRELGTAKVFGHHEGEVFRLGVGLSPVERRGSLVFEPRHYNLRWIKGTGERWNLAFEASSGATGGGGGAGTYAGGFVNTAGAGLELARVVFP